MFMQVATVMLIILWDAFKFGQISLSPQVKWSLIIGKKHGIYELPCELPNELRHRIFRNQEISRKFQNVIELCPSAQSSSQNENLVTTRKKTPIKLNLNFSRSVLFHMKTRVFVQYLTHDCRLRISWLTVYS